MSYTDQPQLYIRIRSKAIMCGIVACCMQDFQHEERILRA